ncbi:hypothetical protein [Actinoplanes philippinensis]|uniref:hypothetical protein n=1 Tax=Actinoplanes philippinensis TaxID=35752 RepID=UPI00341126A5
MTIRGLLHRATHRIPGVPAHTGHPAGHPARTNPTRNHRHHRPATRPPRFLPAWQRRIAALFRQEP